MDFNKLFKGLLQIRDSIMGVGGFVRITTGSTGYKIIAYTSPSATFSTGETVTGGTSGATGTVVNDTGSYLILNNIVGTFQNAETLTGGTSGTTATESGTASNINYGNYNCLKADGAADAVLAFLVQQNGTVYTAVTIVKGTDLKGSFIGVAFTSGIAYAYTKPTFNNQ